MSKELLPHEAQLLANAFVQLGRAWDQVHDLVYGPADLDCATGLDLVREKIEAAGREAEFFLSGEFARAWKQFMDLKLPPIPAGGTND